MCRSEAKAFIFFPTYILNMVNHPIKKGPEGGRHQCSHGKERGLLNGPIKTGPQGGHFQGPKNDPRYLLKVKSVKAKK